MRKRSFSVTIVNLDADAARLQHMREQACRAGLQFVRYRAWDGARLPDWTSAYFAAGAVENGILSAGELGCYASHLDVCRSIAAGEISAPALVLEDDVALSSDFAEVIEAVIAALPHGWDIVRLANEPKHACIKLGELRGGRALVRYTNVPGGAGASLWSRSGAAKFAAKTPRELPFDQDLRFVWRWKLDTFGVWPAPALRDRCGPSRIDAMAPPGWRNDKTRVRRIRRARGGEWPQRHLFGLKTFGVAPWLAAEVSNIADRLTSQRSPGARIVDLLKR